MSRAVYDDDVIKLLNKGWKSGVYPLARDVRALPSAQPERKTGRWISVFDEDEDKCSECQAAFFCASTRFDFCPNCGADMRGKQP